MKPNKVKSIDKHTSFISLYVNEAFLEYLKKSDKNSPMLDVLLMDPANSPLIFPHNFQMRGDRIRVPFDLGWRIFTIKVLRFQNLNNDPHFDCEEYNEVNSYGASLKKELRNIYEVALNCTPPLLSEEPSADVDVCNKRFNVTEDEGNKIRDLFDNNFNFKPTFCKKPCTQTTYEVQSMQVIKSPISSIGLNFDSFVDLTESEFKTTIVAVR